MRLLMSVIFTLCILVTACEKKQQSAFTDDTSSESLAAKLTPLLDMAYSIGDETNDQEIMNSLKTLPAAEFDAFNRMRVNYDIARLDAMLAGKDPRVSDLNSEQIDFMKSQIRLAADMRIALNAIAQQQYGKTVLNIPRQVRDSLMKTLLDGEYAVLFIIPSAYNSSADITAKAEAACNSHYLPNDANVRSCCSGVNWSAYNSGTKYPQTDCDYIFTWPGNRNKMRGEDLFAREMLEDFGNHTARSTVSSASTRLIFGRNTLLFWMGHPALTSVTMHCYQC